MKIKGEYHITKEEFIHIYQVHVRYKFKLRRSLYMSVCLFAFGLLMEHGVGMDFTFINTFVFWIMIAAFVINLLADFILPKTAYNNLKIQKVDQGWMELHDDYLQIGRDAHALKKEWSTYDTCIECEEAILLYKKDSFTMIMKSMIGSDLDNVRAFLKENVNRGKDIIYRR